MQFIAYIRKSTDDKTHQVKSIPNQIEWVEEMEKRLGVEVVRTFVDKRTARKPGREGFNEMMELINSSNQPYGILTWKISRLSRNPYDEGIFKQAFVEGKIPLVYASDRQFKQGDNIILMAVEFGTATQYSIDLSTSTTFGMKKKAASGYRPTLAPLGYLNDPHGIQGEKKIYKDPKRFDLLQTAWKKLLMGGYSVEVIRQELIESGCTSKQGKPVAKSTLYNIFSNPFYAGQYVWNNETHQGKHPKMITPAEFEKAQKILHQWKWGRNYKQTKSNTYNGLLLCAECGYKFTTYCKTKIIKKTGQPKTYTYLKCTKKNPHIKCTQRQINEDFLEQQIEILLSEIQIPYLFIDWIIGFVKRREKETLKVFAQKKRIIQKQYNDVEAMIDTLIDNLNSGNITPDRYSKTMSRYEKKAKVLQNQIASFNTVSNDWYDRIQEDFSIANSAKKMFVEGGKNQKREILSRIGSNWILNDGKLVPKLFLPFQLIRNHRELIHGNFPLIEPSNLLSSISKNRSQSYESTIWGPFLDQVRTFYCRNSTESQESNSSFVGQ